MYQVLFSIGINQTREFISSLILFYSTSLSSWSKLLVRDVLFCTSFLVQLHLLQKGSQGEAIQGKSDLCAHCILKSFPPSYHYPAGLPSIILTTPKSYISSGHLFLDALDHSSWNLTVCQPPFTEYDARNILTCFHKIKNRFILPSKFVSLGWVAGWAHHLAKLSITK